MCEKPLQKVLSVIFIPRQSSVDLINRELAGGYELTDITPGVSKTGGAIFTVAYGVYTNYVILTLTRSDRRQSLHCRHIRYSRDYMTMFRTAVEEENEQGYMLFRTIPANGWVDPEAHQGIGKGTYGFGLFFLKTGNMPAEEENPAAL